MLGEVREEELNEAPPSRANRQGSPSGARPVGQHELDCLGIDQRGIRYWNGQPIQSWRFILTRGQKVWAVLVALAAVAGGLGSCAQGFLTYHDWACREGLPTLPCHMGQMDDNTGQ
jgi:hypothetical protein